MSRPAFNASDEEWYLYERGENRARLWRRIYMAAHVVACVVLGTLLAVSIDSQLALYGANCNCACFW